MMDDRFDSLLAGYFERLLSPQEEAEFFGIIEQNSEAADLFVEYAEMDSGLVRILVGDAARLSYSSSRLTKPAKSARPFPLFRSLAIAAILLLGIGLAWVNSRGRPPVQPSADGKNWQLLGAAGLPMMVTKVSGVAKSTGSHDSVTLSGVLPNIPAGFSPTGQALTVNYAGAIQSFTLDSHARAHGLHGTATLTIKHKPKHAFAGGNVKFAIKIANGSFASVWGFDPNATLKTTLLMNVTIQVDGLLYGEAVSVSYVSKARMGAKFKR